MRIHARWVAIAPDPAKTTPPSGFDPRNPDEPQYNWGALDRAVSLTTFFGIKPMLAVTGSGPLWSSREPSRGNPRFKPDPKRFADFATAVARRYRQQVDRYLVWNEPNQPGWLQPQLECAPGARRCSPVAPHIYRDLVNAATPAIKTADPTAKVLIGTLAPKGSDPVSRNKPMRPLPFIRALGCVDSHYKRIRTGACAHFKAPRADGFAYHPHGVLRSPDEKNPNGDEAAIADLPRLEKVLDRVQAAGGIRPTGTSVHMPLYLTEFGYQTNPPDPYSGVTPAQQARWLQQATYLAWRDPRVKTLVQYEWRDDPIKSKGLGRKAYAGWQSGLVDAANRAKPALAVFLNPFWIDARPAKGGAPRFWGQVRPGGAHTVTIERRNVSGGGWTPVTQMPTDSRGYFVKRLPVNAAADFRFAYDLAGRDRTATPRTVLSATLPIRKAPLLTRSKPAGRPALVVRPAR